MTSPHSFSHDGVGRDGSPDRKDPSKAGPTTPGARARAGGGGASLPLVKLRGLPPLVRAALRRRGIATCAQLLGAAGRAGDRARLAREAGVPPETLLALVLRADLARVDGVGTVFGLMLEDLGIRDVQALATQEAGELHARLHAHNREERLARRSPTPEEVRDWVEQARGLSQFITYD